MSPTSKPARARRTSAQTREHVLAVARERFYWQGICATGVDRIAAEAQIAPTTLYRLFGSKDALIAAYVAREHLGFQRWFDAAVEAAGPSPQQRIAAVFDALDEQVQPDRCRGCPFVMVLAELPDPQSEAHRLAVANKRWVRDRLGELVVPLRVDQPEILADQLALVVDAVYASVAALGVDGPARSAATMVAQLIDDVRG